MKDLIDINLQLILDGYKNHSDDYPLEEAIKEIKAEFNFYESWQPLNKIDLQARASLTKHILMYDKREDRIMNVVHNKNCPFWATGTKPFDAEFTYYMPLPEPPEVD